MLVIGRKPSERILVGDNIIITVVRIREDQVRLGIDAPDDVLIIREELAPWSLNDGPPHSAGTKDASGTD